MAALSGPRELKIVVGDETLVALVRESSHRRTLRMVVRPGRPLELTVPRRTSTRALRRFLDEHADWLAERVAAAREHAARTPALGLQQAGAVWLAGERLPIVCGAAGASTAARRGDTLVVSGPPGEAGAAVARWYRREARQHIEDAVAREALRLHLAYERVAIRDQRTRWGSCSTRGTLSFNWRLIVAPPGVLEYVVVHEVLHVQEANHSRRFWSLLDEHRPGWRSEAGWLREHGQELLAYDPALNVE